MATSDTNLPQLIIHELTKEQYEALTPEPNQLYLTPDESLTADDLKTINGTSVVGSGDIAVQPTLVSGTNIKTINGNSILGSGNVGVGTVTSVNNVSPVNGNVSISIPAAQVNSDWNATSGLAQILNKPTLATVATSGSYNDLTNKPTIPTVNNATLTIQKNGTTVNTFSANASSNVTANITVPTSISDLTDDTSTTPIDKADTLTGLTASVTELNYVDGVTSSIQTQLDGKADTTLSNVSSINANSAVQTALDGKVSKSGDTMTGQLTMQGGRGILTVEANEWGSIILKNSNIDKTVSPSSAQYMGIDFRDKNDTRLGFLGIRQIANSTDTRLEFQNQGSSDFVFGHSTSVDGQWINSHRSIVASTDPAEGEVDVNISSYLPDTRSYELLVNIVMGGTTSTACYVRTSLFGPSSVSASYKQVYCVANTRSANTFIVPIGTERTFTYGFAGTGNYFYIRLFGYRRIGTNT